MYLNYASFRAEFARKRSQTSFDRCNEVALVNKRNHFLHLSELTHERAEKHHQQSPIQARKAAIRATRSPNKPIEMWEYSDCGSGLVDSETEKGRARWDWWMKAELWTQGAPRRFPDEDMVSDPMYSARPFDPTEYEAIARIKNAARLVELRAQEEKELNGGVAIAA